MEPAHGTSGADQEVERRLEVRDALAGLASLSEMQRQVMLSTALEGRSHGEIADTLGLSHGAVRGLIFRARATLRAAAAALTPSPLLHWAARQEVAAGGRSAGIYEAIVGGGSAGPWRRAAQGRRVGHLDRGACDRRRHRSSGSGSEPASPRALFPLCRNRGEEPVRQFLASGLARGGLARSGLRRTRSVRSGRCLGVGFRGQFFHESGRRGRIRRLRRAPPS